MDKGNNKDNLFYDAYSALFPVIYKVAYRITGDESISEDLCHEAFIKYYERIEPLPDLEQTKYWLIRVVKNISFNYEKRKSRQKKAYKRLTDITSHYIESGEKRYIKNETRGAVQQALNKLPHKLRIALVLKEYTRLNYKEIGAILGISEGNVKVRIFRARSRLEKIFKEEKIDVSE